MSRLLAIVLDSLAHGGYCSTVSDATGIISGRRMKPKDTPLNERAVFNTKEAALYLCFEPHTIREKLVSGELLGWRTQGRYRGDWRVSKVACDDWIARQEQASILGAEVVRG